MTARQVVTLNETTPQLEVPQSGDTYSLPRNVDVSGNITVSGTVDGVDIATLNTNALTSTSLNTLAKLNAIVADATLGDSSDFATAAQGATADTALQTADIDTLAELNAIITDATLIDTADSRLSDARTPTAHNQAWSTITSTPTTLAGYGITDANAPEGTAVKSTGEIGGTKFLREDGDGTSSWQAIPGGGDALTANPLSQFAATTSAQLAGVMSDETGSGALVFATSPTLVTPALGTPASGTLTNCTGYPTTGLGLTASPLSQFAATTSAQLAGVLSDETGSGAAVFATSPTLVTPALGTPASGNLSNCNGYTQVLGIACGDETTAITTGNGKAEFQIVDGAFTLTAIYATLTTAGTGSTITIDVNLNGTTLMTTNKITIDATEKTSDTAATAPTLTTTALTENGVITVDFDAVDSGGVGAGPKVYLVGYWT